MSKTISILFAKNYTDPDTGLAYSKGVTYPVSHDVAIKAAKARKTMDEDAIALLEASGEKQNSQKSYSKMKNAELIEELKARDVEGSDEHVTDLTAQIEAANKAKDVAAEQVTQLTADAQIILDAHNASLGKDDQGSRCDTLADLAALITVNNEG